jgi:hypothetical protein
MVHYGAPPDFRRGRDNAEVVRRVEEMERALARGRGVRFEPRIPFDLGDWTIPGLAGATKEDP